MYCPECGNDMRRSDRDPRYMVCDNCRKKFFMPVEDFYEDTDYRSVQKQPIVKEKRNACIVISLIITVAYLAYSAYYWIYAAIKDINDLAGQLGFDIARAAVMPHLVAVVMAFIFNWIGIVLPNRWFILVSAILYSIGILLFPVYFMFIILQVILSFVGFGLMVSNRNKQKTKLT